MTILLIEHGKGEEQRVLFEGIRATCELGKAKQQLADKEDRITKMLEALAASVTATNSAKKMADSYKEAYQTLDAAIKKHTSATVQNPSLVESPPNYSSAVPQTTPSYIPSITKAEEVEAHLPNWQMPTRNQALVSVRKNASAKYGTDFNMVEYELEKQMKAFDKLTQYQKQNWKPLMRTLLNSAASKWPNDYSMMVYEIEKQIDAKDRLDGGR
jgi:septation ring formation regulator EzrA